MTINIEVNKMIADALSGADGILTDEMRTLFEKAKAGDAASLSVISEEYLRGNDGFPKDPQKAYLYASWASEKGSARADTVLGMLYQDGIYVEKDLNAAVSFYEKASEAGDFKAPRLLGMLYEAGDGVPQDDETAARYYTLAAERGDITGQYLLGRMYEQGRGVPQDYERAMALYLESGKRGDEIAAPAIGAVADLYRKGLGVPKDEAVSDVWQRRYEAAKNKRIH